MQEPNRRQSVCVSWGSTEPVMPNQHSTTYMGSPQHQAAPRNAVFKELYALSPLYGNNAAPGKCQPRCSCFHEAPETSRTATKPGLSGVYSGFFWEQAGGATHNILQCNVFVFLLLQHITLESSSCMKCPPRTSSEHPGLGSCVGSTAAEGHWNPVPPEASQHL